MRRDIPLAKWGHAIRIRSKEGGGKKAVAAVARRMCVAGYHVLRTQKPYDDSKSDYKAAQKSTQKALGRVEREMMAMISLRSLLRLMSEKMMLRHDIRRPVLLFDFLIEWVDKRFNIYQVKISPIMMFLLRN
jgi:hypothetical protein